MLKLQLAKVEVFFVFKVVRKKWRVVNWLIACRLIHWLCDLCQVIHVILLGQN